MGKTNTIVDYQTAVTALKRAIKTVEERVKRSIGVTRRVSRDGTVDHSHDDSLANDLDDLVSAKIVLAKVESLVSGQALNETQKAWFSILLWDGSRVVGRDAVDSLYEQQSHKYQNTESLRCLVFKHLSLVIPSATREIKSKITLLLPHFSIDSQVTVESAYTKDRTSKIKEHQTQSLCKLSRVMSELESYGENLPVGDKKREVKALVDALKRHKQTYENYLTALVEIPTDFAARKVFFQKNRTFVNDCILTIRTAHASLDLHRHHHLRVIVANLLIAITGVGLFALGARFVYSLFNPSTTALFFAKTHSRAKVDELEGVLGEVEEIKPTAMMINPMLAAKAA